MPLETLEAYCREINIQFSGNSSGGLSSTNLFTFVLVSISFLPKGMIITQVHLVLGTIKGHSKMCSFVTQHNATDVSIFMEVQLALQECPSELFISLK
jgi:hypothetical protein